ncbi:C45 family autoproteolytic acyltransferase/hydolase [Clostridium lundense]|uniref:C45 family autoproteolytic acyltransferase/hydolase n=1 Tax=Clostridium lundense TaxID=319475 RepID=UPI00048160C7|nr:C45 family peptidase [Clostridium lundense]
MENKMRFLHVKGTAYERGRMSGIELRQAIQRELENYKHLLHNKEIMEKVDKVKKVIEDTFPEYLQEVNGRADGASVNRDVYFLIMCPEILNEGVGCTSLVYKREDGTFILAHNEDDIYKPSNSAITKCDMGNEWFTTYDYCNMPFGNAFSFNSHGIVKTINYCYSDDMNIEGIPRYFIQRHISEAKSLNDFINRCNIANRASGFHAIALDINKNQCVSIETTASHISVEEIKDYYVHTNHYIHKDINKGIINVQEGSTSIFRLNKGKELLIKGIENQGDKLNVDSFIEMLNYRGTKYSDSILALKNEPNFTCARFAIDTREKNKAWLQFFDTQEGFFVDYK